MTASSDHFVRTRVLMPVLFKGELKLFLGYGNNSLPTWIIHKRKKDIWFIQIFFLHSDDLAALDGAETIKRLVLRIKSLALGNQESKINL